MDQTIAVVMPAYKAQATIAGSVRSVLAQSFTDWQLHIVSDDGSDYEAFLAGHGIRDPRLRFVSSGAIAGGATRARNVALEAITAPYVAILDADDQFTPEKLMQTSAALGHHGIVSCALDVVDSGLAHLRFVAAGADRELSPGQHKWVNLSMDSMIGWDRRLTDARYDTGLPNMADLELLMRLYRTVPRSFHLGRPLHRYVKIATSMSNKPGMTAGMVTAKTELVQRLEAGAYPMADATGPQGFREFLVVSLEAEEAYPAALAARPGLLFEDHIEPRLLESTRRPAL